MEKIINKENKWEQMVETDIAQGPVEKVARNQIVEAMQKMKSGKTAGPSEVSVEMIEPCQHVLDGRGMPDEWKTSVILPIF